jgi:LytS/YehU family sensor histidine kinase
MSFQAYLLELRAGTPMPYSDALIGEMIYAYLWGILSVPILYFSSHLPVQRGSVIRNLTFLTILGASFSVIHKISYEVGEGIALSTKENPFSLGGITGGFFRYLDYGFMVYCIIVLIDQSLRYYAESHENATKAARLESQLAQARLHALKMQLQPHFLFNTLNAISVLVEKNPASARQTILRLADLLRSTLEGSEQDEVPLSQEIEFIMRYLEIERTRFEDRLEVQIDIPESLLSAQVPNLILQPLVENAMKHGVSHKRGGATISISAGRNNGTLSLAVRDNGPGLGSAEIRDGIGLSNTRNRLRQLYGDEQALACANVPDGGFEVSLTLPYHE